VKKRGNSVAYRTAKFVSDLATREKILVEREQELASVKTSIVEDKIRETQRLTRYRQALRDLLDGKEDARKRAEFLLEADI